MHAWFQKQNQLIGHNNVKTIIIIVLILDYISQSVQQIQ